MRYLTAGESHGSMLVGILEGMPAGLRVDTKKVDEMLAARQDAPGRGDRQRLCRDRACLVAGLNGDVTTGAPIAVIINNGECGVRGDFRFYRPGHVDYAADIKYGYGDPALGAERASARNTAMTTALGAVALQLLETLGISVEAESECDERAIERARQSGDTVGGKVTVTVRGIKAGFGSHVSGDRRLDGLLGGALMAIPAVKAVEFGLGVGYAERSGKQVADTFRSEQGRIVRDSNNCGGIEGGISNGSPIVVRLTVKPIPSIEGLSTVDDRGKPCLTGKVRGDVSAVFAAATVSRAVTSLTLASAILDCLGGDTVAEVKDRYDRKGS